MYQESRQEASKHYAVAFPQDHLQTHPDWISHRYRISRIHLPLWIDLLIDSVFIDGYYARHFSEVLQDLMSYYSSLHPQLLPKIRDIEITNYFPNKHDPFPLDLDFSLWFPKVHTLQFETWSDDYRPLPKKIDAFKKGLKDWFNKVKEQGSTSTISEVCFRDYNSSATRDTPLLTRISKDDMLA